ncbi:MAG: muconate cycloisomerase [Alcaligenaceae bacterium]|nr:muconate cycloisomerase [Alcaligenaceae bacterium]|tara:strand:- start:19084 stop:20250 length:1167 start_codon:yes stop_codon:yes gene_type:complete
MNIPMSSDLIHPVIERVETRIVDLPTIRPHKLSVGTMHGQSLMLLSIVCSDGVTGMGEGTTIAGMAYGPESPETMKQTVDTYLAPAIIGKDPTRIQGLMTYVGKLVKVNHFAKSALETALLDAHGKRLGVSLSELLGGRRRDRLPVAWTLASGNTAQDIDEAEKMLALRRHNVFKLKIGAKALKTDIQHVADIKKALGDRAAVRVDINMVWSEIQAAWGIPALADAGCELVEQPVASAAALGRLMRRFPVPLMADEVLQGPESAFAIAKESGSDVFAVKIEQSGGLYAAQRVAAIADAAGIELYGGTMLEGAISTIASAHLFASFANLQWGTELFGPLLITEQILTQPLEYSDFELTVPTGPGLGITLNEAQVQRFTREGSIHTVSHS